MNEFNSYIKVGSASIKVFPGATPKELLHYCVPSLDNLKPDVCILNIGTNSVNKDDTSTITKDIGNIVKRCHEYGVNKVYVSTVICRPQFQNKVDQLNTSLRAAQVESDYELIENGNIIPYHLCRDRLHLNNKGIIILARIFLRCINSLQSS